MRFEDILYIPIREGAGTAQLDPVFVAVCEPNTITAIGCVLNVPHAAGVTISGGQIHVTAPTVDSGIATIKLSGIRKGRRGHRFTPRTHEEMERNERFWNGWRAS